jgi:hypothetical protein
MILTINDHVLLDHLKEHFAKCYPGLKIEFYKTKHKGKLDQNDSDLITANIRVGTIRKKGLSGDYKIYSFYTVSRVENELHDIYGLNVQVFRNENNAWIQTTTTDYFTLAQQIKMSRQATQSIYPIAKEQLDEYDEL